MKNSRIWTAVAVTLTLFLCVFVLTISTSAEVSLAISDNVLTVSGTGDMPNGAVAPDYADTVVAVVIEDGVTSIGDYAFAECYLLESVTIPGTVRSIGAHAFDGCESLTLVSVPASVTEIGENAFFGCHVLTTVTLGEGLVSIAPYAFSFCTSLETVAIPGSVKSVGAYAFAYCQSLTSASASGDTVIDSFAFLKCASGFTLSVSDSHTHTSGDWIITVAATCTETGRRHRVCTFCGEETEAETIPATGHREVTDAALAPTCTKTGLTAGTHCSICGKILTAQQPVPATGHLHTQIKGQEDASCTESGYTGDTYCTDCEQKIATGKAIPAVGHHFVDGICTLCGASGEKFTGFTENGLGERFYYKNGEPVYGWFEVNGVTYYARRESGVLVEADHVIGGKLYRWSDAAGLTVMNGFYDIAGGTVCYADGIRVSGWRHADGTGPLVSSEGVSEQYSGNPQNLYYFLSTGEHYMVTDSTYTLGGYLREFNEDHTVKPLNGLQLRYGILYHYVDGALQYGWYTDEESGATYYFQGNHEKYGQAAVMWMYIDNKIYYFTASTYELKTSGTIGGIAYAYDPEDGHILYTGFINCDNANANHNNTAAYIQKRNATSKYYVNGVMQTGWQQIDGNWYYFYLSGSANGSGYMCCTSRTVGGVWYEFSPNGICTSR